MRRRVHLHGAFKAFHKGPIEIVADTIWDAVEAVVCQVKGFAPDARTGKKRIQVVGYSTIESLKSHSDDEDIHIIPAMAFGKQDGLFQTIIGITLLVIAAFMGGTFWPAIVASLGASLMAGGIMQMLSPQPQLGAENAEQERSKYLATNQNTVKIGTTIPLLYGRYRAYPHIMSLNIDAKDTGL